MEKVHGIFYVNNIMCNHNLKIDVLLNLKAPSFALLISRYILRLGQAAQKQQRPRFPYQKMNLAIIEPCLPHYLQDISILD